MEMALPFDFLKYHNLFLFRNSFKTWLDRKRL